MPGSKLIRIFTSYAHADGAGLAQQLTLDLAARGFKPWLDKHRLYGGAIWTKEIENAIDQAEVVLALLTRGSYLSEICRAEQLRSLRKEKCVIPLLAQTGADVPLHLEARQYLNFTVAGDYLQQFESLLKSIAARDGVVLYFVRREQSPPHRADRARWYGRDRQDGAGASIPALNQALGKYDDERGCVNQYRNFLRTRAALIVLYDVWDVHRIESFRAASPRSRLLFTTRDSSLASAFGAAGFTVDLCRSGRIS